MDFEAIRKSYPSIVTLAETFVDYGLDKDGNKVSIVQSKVDAARTTINKELTDTKYQRDRAAEYPRLEEQLDDIYHNGIDAWKASIKAIKDKYPKP